ncbi:hypothetical protein QE152_g38539 [Popillia japonica]|uniref:Uncharacterized protein n=1 Tax=Popillia japonica TaxID=7064 RepID=A0AAW1HW77_POPJA
MECITNLNAFRNIVGARRNSVRSVWNDSVGKLYCCNTKLTSLSLYILVDVSLHLLVEIYSVFWNIWVLILIVFAPFSGDLQRFLEYMGTYFNCFKMFTDLSIGFVSSWNL